MSFSTFLAQTAYFGDIADVVEHFANMGLHISPHYNPADFIMEQVKGPSEIQRRLILASKELGSSRRKWDQRSDSIEEGAEDSGWLKGTCDVTEESTHDEAELRVVIDPDKKAPAVYTKIEGDEGDSGRSSWSEDSASHASTATSTAQDDWSCSRDPKWPTSFWTQFKVLTKRNFAEARPRMLSTLNWAQTIALGIVAGLIWFQVERKEEALGDIRGWMFFSSTYWMLFALFEALASCTFRTGMSSAFSCRERLG
ncbi:unnamed protein product [Darwinula stevensoni]|uniref:ABC-2 type transporter transmembrane domain-containing protein n=1 Tax=Darwinula stevensoni TaxID=69355 RepID=A0A7R9FTV4_9CRUS|nr:unnamed protein product [Darwinula stevensoni]CAG0905633.1 unnamed protein product [Darwinula stevensoni]